MAKDKSAWGYRRGDNGEVESRIFEDGELPKGWVDSPSKVKKDSK